MNHVSLSIAPLYLRSVALVSIGALVGAFIVSTLPVVLDFTSDQYDTLNPVVREIHTRVESRTEDEVVIHMDGFKQRRGCVYVGLQASVKSESGVSERVFLRRIDRPETGDTLPLGPINMGTWRIWPTAGADRVEVHSQHVCSGRLVTALFASIALKPDKVAP